MQEETQDRRIKRTKMLLQNALVDLMLEKAVGKISDQRADSEGGCQQKHILSALFGYLRYAGADGE